MNYDKSCGSSKSNEKNYYLLNKDVTVARFRVNMRNQVITIDEQYIELPEWFGELDTFIVNRRSPKKRENIVFLVLQITKQCIQIINLPERQVIKSMSKILVTMPLQ